MEAICHHDKFFAESICFTHYFVPIHDELNTKESIHEGADTSEVYKTKVGSDVGPTNLSPRFIYHTSIL